MYARFSKVIFNIWSQLFYFRKWPSFHREYLLCQVLQQTWLACLLQPCDYPGPGNECGEMKLRGEQRADHPGPPPRSQPQFRYFRPFRIFLKIWTQRLICTPPLSSLHSSARLVMQPAMGGERWSQGALWELQTKLVFILCQQIKNILHCTSLYKIKKRKESNLGLVIFYPLSYWQVKNIRLMSRAPKTLLGWRRICRREERILLRRFSGPNDRMTWSL